MKRIMYHCGLKLDDGVFLHTEEEYSEHIYKQLCDDVYFGQSINMIESSSRISADHAERLVIDELDRLRNLFDHACKKSRKMM